MERIEPVDTNSGSWKLVTRMTSGLSALERAARTPFCPEGSTTTRTFTRGWLASKAAIILRLPAARIVEVTRVEKGVVGDGLSGLCEGPAPGYAQHGGHASHTSHECAPARAGRWLLFVHVCRFLLSHVISLSDQVM
ncbi:hypothetical protein LP416_08205 [Polaromonas sp. P2-4]|nr:hypothetical protein LP416_08205 [Polaromonas sp. P2-4]